MSFVFCCCYIGLGSISRCLNLLIYLLLILTAVARDVDAMPGNKCNEKPSRTDPLLKGRCLIETMSLFCDGSYLEPEMDQGCSNLTCIEQLCIRPVFVPVPGEERERVGFAPDLIPGTTACTRSLSRMSFKEARDTLEYRTKRTENMACVERFDILCGKRSEDCSTHNMVEPGHSRARKVGHSRAWKVGHSRVRKVSANSVGEFNKSECGGEFVPEVFSKLRNICEKCYSLYRDRDVYVECRANCFKNSKFPKCVSELIHDHIIKLI